VLQLLASGVAQGCVYGLIALGFALVYKATEVVTFAQGELLMLGAFAVFVLTATFGWPFWIATMVAVAAVALVGAALERVVIRPVLGQPAFSLVLLTLGMGYVMRGAVTMVPGIGTDTHTLSVPYQGQLFKAAGVVIAYEQLVIIGMTAVLCALLYVAFRYTRVGIAMQAASQNQLAAYYMGIPVQRLNTLVWALAAGVAALAGILVAPITFVHVNVGFIGLKAFPAAVVGGFGSLPGAIVGGLVIGIAESLAGFYLPEGVKDVVPYLLVLLMLMIRPHGLFGEHQRKKV
jgi:branched-chain amino acid transport system permease protein